MKKERKEQAAEPIGIVISSGVAVEPSPRFSAYVWGPAPEPEVQVVEAGQKSL
jgi:hypothetical protein